MFPNLWVLTQKRIAEHVNAGLGLNSFNNQQILWFFKRDSTPIAFDAVGNCSKNAGDNYVRVISPLKEK